MSQEQEIHTLMEVTKTLHSRLEGLLEVITGLQERSEEAAEALTAFGSRLDELSASHADLTNELRGALNGFEPPEEGIPDDESDEERATRVGLIARVAEVESLIRGRNRSAPMKRNMTDADAMRVLVGDVAELGHKEAGEQVGLTYAQVYSCRLEYTFKHVHKKLRDSGWKNTFVK